MNVSEPRSCSTRLKILTAAHAVLVSDGFAGLSTRAVADAAETQMSQIRYHFGSKEGMILALFEHMTDNLIARQVDLFADPDIALSKKWQMSCDYLDADFESGYVRVLQELIAVGWSNRQVGDPVRASLARWRDLHVDLVKGFAVRMGGLGPFAPEDVAALVGAAFIGAEAYLLLGLESDGLPVRQALRRVGKIIEHYENQPTPED